MVLIIYMINTGPEEKLVDSWQASDLIPVFIKFCINVFQLEEASDWVQMSHQQQQKKKKN